MKKKVCHISTAHPENDGRILFKQCSSISKAGYEVSLIVTADKEKIINGVKIIPLSKNNNRIYRMFYKTREAYNKAVDVDADIYHFHDPELIPLGKKLKKIGKKVIYDVHEDMPKQILSKKYLGSMKIRKLISKAFNKYEKNNSKGFDSIVTTQDEFKEKFLDYHNNIVVVKNFAMKDIIDETVPIIINEAKGKFIIIYIGSITKIRGIKEMINSTESFKGKVELWVIGGWETEELFKECTQLAGYKYTRYFGKLPISELYKYVKAADLGMSILHPTPNYKEAIPTKVFEYMACELPVILSDFPFWARLFGDIGTYVNPLDLDEIIRTIEYYRTNKEIINAKGKENRRVFENKFCWDTEEAKLIKLYDSISKN
ncbi:glycosyltransferase [Clostridium gasigenes]|uniref:Glycosyltransferase involved in cell wall bisynthesis n=1 Tax=Clostridium gasigenes TaxID=94869 RepID=A0A1H0THV1_9CLOT|nr:glycosyltransferase [Clostridium gasigenes]MBB6624628.1 glycosyltransferase [Clostridium gasigenes]MBU3103183.1 glycosyltransferase [Clostridium gasigenes]MBU3133187.1 glycosyltransferase [Clostridium gasigenes]MBU3137136.1 glycosyltransferase [Clostridium gasigenes]SDP53411.1 Glycosyltransferase involved in cell wall bisynthesis [Clostridium gasigenes]